MTEVKYAPVPTESAPTESAPTEPPPSYEMAAQPTSSKPSLRAPLPLDLHVINSIRGKRCILASASPRRKQLLSQVSVPFRGGNFKITADLPPRPPPVQIGLTNLEVRPSPLPEDLPKSLSPFEYVLQTATKKAVHIYSTQVDNTELGEPAIVLAADTVVVSHMGHVLEKPRSEADHIGMLTMLRNSGHHRVYTAVVVMAPLRSAREPGYAMESTVEETTVRFGKDLSDEMILAYVRTREGADKAGGYGIQGIGAILVDRVEGSFDNVVGLPLRVTLGLIEKALAQSDAEEMGDEFAEADEEDG